MRWAIRSISWTVARYDEKLFIDWPFPSCFFLGYTTLHDRNDNSTPPSATQMSYLQMNSLRNGSNASSGTAGNQTSIYPMLKEENNSSSSGNNSAINYTSLSDLSVSLKTFLFIRTCFDIIFCFMTELWHYSSSTLIECVWWTTARLPITSTIITLSWKLARVLRWTEWIKIYTTYALQEFRKQRNLLKSSTLWKWIWW